MAKVLVDVSVYSKDWLKNALREMQKNNKVIFIYSDVQKYRNEIVKVPKLAQFLKEMRDQGRRVDAPSSAVAALMTDLENDPTWNSNKKVCDDPHIFAIMEICGGGYVMTDEKRLCVCRSCMAPTRLDMCKFKVIRTEGVYKAARRKILR